MDLALRLLLGLLILVGLVSALTLRGGGTLSPRAQLRAVGRARFTLRPIMNRSEYRVFAWLEQGCRGTPFRAFAQVPYGEILATPDEDAFRSINSKRADILVVDGRGLPVLAVEYQGEGHWKNGAKARDAVKRAALAAAGLPLLEVFPDTRRTDVQATLREAIAAAEERR